MNILHISKTVTLFFRGHRFRLFLAGLAITVFMAFLYVFEPEFIQSIELKTYDALFRSMHAARPSGSVAIVDIDEDALTAMGQWPWPRYRVALMVEKIRRAGAAAIVLDIVFAEEDRTSPALLQRMLEEELGVNVDFEGLPPALADNDEVLAKVLGQGPYVLGYYLLLDEPTASGKTHPGSNGKDPGVENAGTAGSRTRLKVAVIRTPDAVGVDRALFQAKGAVENIPVLARATQASGFINVGMDRDGTVRRAPLVMIRDGRICPSLALAAILLTGRTDSAMLRMTSGGAESLRVAGRTVPLDSRGRMLLHYRGGRKTIPTHPVLDVLRDRLKPEILKGKIVFVGTSAAGLMDVRTTPLDPFYPGVEVQATVADTILRGDFLRRPDWAPGLEMTFVVGMGLLSTLLLVRLGGLWPLLILAALASSSWIGAQLTLAHKGLYLSPLMPLLTLAGNFGMLSFLKFRGEEREKRKVRSSFEHYLSPEVISRVLKNPEMLKLGGEKKELTVMFSDIRNFTTLSENLEPQDLVAFMNEFHSAMTGIILDRGGTLDKYIGDAIMAFFGAPVAQPDHAAIGCRTALSMIERLYECRKNWCFPGFSRIEIGVGISSGEMVVGNMGSVKRLSYTVMGDQVNLASRLEGLTKIYGVKILISQFTHARIREEITCREIDFVRVKGKVKPVAIFEPFSEDYFTNGKFAFIPPFEQGLLAYRGRRFDAAIGFFERVLDLKPQDSPTILFLERCRTFQDSPPPNDWDGVWVMTRK